MTISMRAVAGATAVSLALLLGSCSDDGDNGGGTTPPDPTGAVAGEVTLEGGGAVAGAGLALERSGANTRNTTTGADGTFEFTAVAVGGWALTITPPVELELAAGQDASVPVTVVDGQTAQADFVLVAPEPPEADASIKATVEADGAASVGTTLRLYEVSGSSILATEETNADGSATFEVTAGDYDVQVVVPEGFQLVEGEQERKTVTAPSGGEATVTFALETEPQTTVQEIEATTNFTFSPAEVTIAAGTTVEWTNDSGMFHTVTPDGHTEWEETALPDGSTFSHTFDTPGTYPYYCNPHQAQGMTGVITVE